MTKSSPSRDRVLAMLRRNVSSDEHAEIRELWKRHSKATQRHDVDGILATLTEDCLYEYVPEGPRWEGHEGARRFHTEILHAFPGLEFELLNIVIGPQGVFQETQCVGTFMNSWLGREAVGQRCSFTLAIFFPWDPAKKKFTGERLYGTPFGGVGDQSDWIGMR
jgi:hypothetical protein